MARFRVDLGHVALNLCATLGGRATTPNERLAGPGDLQEWFGAVGIWPLGAELGSAAASQDLAVTLEQLIATRELREAIFRAVTGAAMADQPPATADLAILNRWAAQPDGAPQLAPDLTVYAIATDPVNAALSRIAREAIGLLGGRELGRVKRCQGCSLIFLDRSRPGERRWCSMERCGNKEKTARYRAKRS